VGGAVNFQAARLHIHHYVASALAIALCSILNFAASEWFVFRK